MGRALSDADFQEARNQVEIGKMAASLSDRDVGAYIAAMLFALETMADAKQLENLKAMLTRARQHAKAVR